jgi:arylsulfatase A-like enzyme
VVCASVGLAATLAAALALPARELSRVAPFEGPIGRPASAELPNLLLIVLDTVRADHLGSYGYGRDTTPFLDDLAARASLFERAVAASSYTLPSHASLFTGLYPESHGARVSEVGKSLEQLGLLADATRVSPLSPEAVTLAELAREAGLETGAVGANLAYLSPAFGLDQGFDSYLVPTRGWSFWQPAGIAIGRKLSERLWPRSWAFWYRSRVIANGRFYLLAPEVNALALRWLESRTETRFFLFLNYMDAHAPYLPAAGYRDLFPFADSPQQLDREAIESGRRQITGAERDPLIDAYDAELRFLDDHLRRLFARLEAWELLSRTAVIIVGDHGESFGEHGELEHATGLREPQLHVPLIVSLPGRTGPERIARPVHLSDVFPTALRMLGLEPPPQLDGVPLFAPERRHPVTAHLGPYGGAAPRDAIYRDSYKLLVEPGKAAALYDVSSDAAEERDLAPDRPELASELHSELRRFKSEVRPRFRPDPAPLDPETRDRLRALGYEP